jgi:hypothetical protein
MTRAEWWRERVIYKFHPYGNFHSIADAMGFSVAGSPVGSPGRSGVAAFPLVPLRQPRAACTL